MTIQDPLCSYLLFSWTTLGNTNNKTGETMKDSLGWEEETNKPKNNVILVCMGICGVNSYVSTLYTDVYIYT